MKRSLGGGAGGDVFILKPLHRLIALCINVPPAIKAHNVYWRIWNIWPATWAYLHLLRQCLAIKKTVLLC